MAKKDVRNDNLLAWDEYKDKPFDKALASIYSHAEDYSKRTCKWYWHSIKFKRRASTIAKFLTLVLLIIGTILPIGAGLGEKAELRFNLTQFGVIALAISGLLQISDRIFGLSSGWLRYITTAMLMENSTRKFELEWASYIIDKGSNISQADVKALFDIAKKFEDDIAKLQTEETDKWATEFNTSTAFLNDLIKSQREAAETTIKSAKENVKAKQKGSVEVAIAQKTPPVPIHVAIDDKEVEKSFLGSYWSKHELEPGHHTLAIKTISDSPQIIKKIIDVPPGDIFKAKIELF